MNKMDFIFVCIQGPNPSPSPSTPAPSTPAPGNCGKPQYNNDDYCDDDNNNAGCNFDGGACCGNLVKKDWCTECKCKELK